MIKLGIIGAGAWGTALALVAARSGCAVTLGTRNEAQALEITQQHTNHKAFPKSLGDLIFDQPLKASNDLSFLSSCDAIVLAIPAQSTRTLCRMLHSLLEKPVPLILTAKGIEHNTNVLMGQIVEQECPGTPYAVLSGPNFAREVAANLPTATTIASTNMAVAQQVAGYFSTSTFRPYLSEDVVGVQVGGAVKNVIAIATGIAEGRQLGENARAALITRGLAEIVRLGLAMGGQLETFLGLSGCGDLTLTCSSRQSRNTSYGILLAQQGNIQHQESTPHPTLREGVFTAQTILALAHHHQVDLPVCTAVHRIVTHALTVDEVLEDLLNRPLQWENSRLFP